MEQREKRAGCVVIALLVLLGMVACTQPPEGTIDETALSSVTDTSVMEASVAPEWGEWFLACRYTPDVPGAVTLPYRLYVPAGQAPEEGWPLLVFLHGSGESGDDNALQISVNTPFERLLAQGAEQNPYPCVMLAPQCPLDTDWNDAAVVASLSSLVEKVAAMPAVDASRIYVVGISMGGFGIFSLLGQKPELFAAALPISGAYLYDTGAETIKDIPLWLFQAADDEEVSVEWTRTTVKKLEAADANVQYTEYPTGGHQIWGRVYNEPEVFAWLFAQHR